MATTDFMIRELPEAERPRERLLAQGSEALSEAELVAVLLRTGRPGTSARQMALDLLRDLGGLPGLLQANPHALRRQGLGPAKAASLLAAVELGRRLAREEMPEGQPLRRPGEVVRYLTLRYQVRDQEVVGALFVDVKNRLIGEREIFRGTLERATADPREILKECLLRGCSGVVLFHTHPSGDPSPSTEDLAFTQRMEEACQVIGVRLVDHLILAGPRRWTSLLRKSSW